MESGSRVIDFVRFLHPLRGFDAPSRLKVGDLDKNGCLYGGDLDFKHLRCQIPLGQPQGRAK